MLCHPLYLPLTPKFWHNKAYQTGREMRWVLAGLMVVVVLLLCCRR